jgi:hypothetical protein
MIALEDKAADGFLESISIFGLAISFVRLNSDVIVEIGTRVTEGVGLRVAIGVIDTDGFKVTVKATRMVALLMDGDSIFDEWNEDLV